MAIIVVCHGCRKSFQVSDKFAGKSGPCPNCKEILRVPMPDEQVQVHVPKEFASGGRESHGKLDLKPITRTDAKLQPLATTIIVAVSLATSSWHGPVEGPHVRHFLVFRGQLAGDLAPLVMAAYAVLRNDEVGAVSRLAAVSFARQSVRSRMSLLWGLFSLLASRGVISGDVWVWVFVAPPFVVVGRTGRPGDPRSRLRRLRCFTTASTS